MNLVLLALFASLSFALPRGAGAARVDALGQQFRAQPAAAVVVVETAPAAVVSAPVEAADVTHGPIPTCNFVPVKGGPQQPYCHHH